MNDKNSLENGFGIFFDDLLRLNNTKKYISKYSSKCHSCNEDIKYEAPSSSINIIVKCSKCNSRKKQNLPGDMLVSTYAYKFFTKYSLLKPKGYVFIFSKLLKPSNFNYNDIHSFLNNSMIDNFKVLRDCYTHDARKLFEDLHVFSLEALDVLHELNMLANFLKIKGVSIDFKDVYFYVLRVTKVSYSHINNEACTKVEKLLINQNISSAKEAIRCMLNFLETDGACAGPKKDFIFSYLNTHSWKISKDNYLKLLHEVENENNLALWGKQLEDTILTEMLSVDFRSMTGIDFEKWIKKLYELQGYSVSETPSTGDQGADLILQKGTEKYVVQCKCYSSPVSNKAIQEAVAAIKHYEATGAIVISTSSFTKSAKSLAKSNHVELIDHSSLMQKISSIAYGSKSSL